ncbi:MAG TPA: LPS assembly lipoprotein LptE [Gemmatimonadaceae bacterium]|nr:LPS assembly lipoprotein LptE [Gemmatimonadaceae bacterium]
MRTLAVLPFDNQTPSPDLQREVFDAMRRGLQSHLGLRDAPEARADAVLRGTLLRYDVDIPVAYSADPRQATTARRRLQIVLDIELVDQRSGKALWQRKGLTAEGEYAESAEAAGRRQAIDKLVNDVVEGAQSQW